MANPFRVVHHSQLTDWKCNAEMSGITGIVRFDRTAIDPEFIPLMTNAMAYRGPDGIHHWHEMNAGFGHCALHTTPESRRERQPLVESASGLTLVMAGRADNWQELRAQLSPHDGHMQTATDAELVLAAFKLWGERFIDYLDGDFALALWSRETQRLFCFRDRLGAKPFHYHWNGRIFSFASDVRALLQLPWIAPKPNLGKIAEVLANEWLSYDETFWQEIHSLPPAHSLTVAATGLSTAALLGARF